MTANERIPVTVLTGFLGAGKTTLIDRILTEPHGQRIAVIENELGEISTDQALVVEPDEEIFEMNNGCICCPMRGDLVRVLGDLTKRRDKFDRIVVETADMATPAPVAQTFFLDEAVQREFRLDGIVTLVDAKHLELHLGRQPQAREQVAFADVIVINKIDLVGAAKLAELERRIRRINRMARVIRARHGDVPLVDLLDVGGFDLDRARSNRPTLLDSDYPFESVGIYKLATGDHEVQLRRGLDPACLVLVEQIGDGNDASIFDAAERASRCMTAVAPTIAPGGTIEASGAAVQLSLQGDAACTFTLRIREPGCYAVFTQHRATELDLVLARADGRRLVPFAVRELVASHDDTVRSVGLEFDRPFDEARLNAWLCKLLREQGTAIFRMKGILAIAGSDRRFVCQGVHMLFDGRPDQPWGGGRPRSQLVFIGKRLDREALQTGLSACLA